MDSHSHLLQDISLCVVAATVLAYLARLTRQPTVLAYIAAGVVIGPIGLKLIHDLPSIQTLAELGLAFLLFIVGLEIDLPRLVGIGRKATPLTLVQVLGSAGLAGVAAMAMGFRGLPVGYIAIAAAFSSTMIVVKLLADRGELNSTHGQLALGVLLLQDVAAIVVLALQPTFGKELSAFAVIKALAFGLGLAAGAILVSRYVLPLLFRWVAKSPEVLLLTALSWCFIICYAALKLEFSIAMGALIAGVSISVFPYSLDVIAKIRGLRDFFVTLFFVSLGMLLTMPTWELIGTAVVISLVVIVSRLVTVWPVGLRLGFTPRVGLLTSLYLAQTSEFGLVVALIGSPSDLGHIERDLVSLIVLVLIITATASTYLIQYSHRIAALVVPQATTTVPDRSLSTALVHDDAQIPIVLVGCHRVGSSLIHELRQAAIDFRVVDFNQGVNEKLNRLGVPTTYGDLSHIDTLAHAGVDRARILICTISDDFLRGTTNVRLLRALRDLNPTATIIVNADSIAKAQRLYEAGADYVLTPRVLMARHLVEVIAEIGAGMLEERKRREATHLKERTEVVP